MTHSQPRASKRKGSDPLKPQKAKGSDPFLLDAPTRTRRDFLRDSFCGFGTLALASLLKQDAARASSLGPHAPHRPDPPAKAVIFLFMAGGPSHLETFDPKPL